MKNYKFERQETNSISSQDADAMKDSFTSDSDLKGLEGIFY